jgi:trehalose/maltose transport system permease protein
MRKWVSRAGFGLLVVAIVLYAAFPFYWAAVTSFKTASELFTASPWPKHLDWANYRAIFAEQPFGRSLLNSAATAGLAVALSLGLGALAAFPLSRRRFAGRKLLLVAFLMISMFPQIAILSGLFELVRWLGLYNTIPGLSISYLALTLPFTVWTLTAFMRGIPRAIEEAAILDGASSWQILTRIFLPIMAPAFVTTGLLAFIAAWNEFLFALTFTLSEKARTVPVAIALMSGSSAHELPWGNIMAASVVVTVPLIVLVFAFQRRIVTGLTAGSVKG